MTVSSGAVGSFVNIADASASGVFDATVSVSGQVSSDFDALLNVYRTETVGEFDAKLCVLRQAERLAPSAVIDTPTVVNSSGIPTFTVAFSGTGYASGDRTIIDYTWFKCDIVPQVSGGQTTTFSFSSSGSYIVLLRVTDSEGFYGFAARRILTYSGVALSLPLLTTSGVAQSGNASLMVDFTSSASGVTGTSILGYSWCFGHNLFSRRQNPTDINFAVPGTYVAVCTAIDSRGVVVADTVEVGANT